MVNNNLYLDLGVSEATKTQLNHGSVVEDLSGRITVMNGVLEVGHEHQVPGLVPVVVDRVVVDVTQDGSGPHTVCQVLAVDELAQLVHHLRQGVQSPSKSHTHWQLWLHHHRNVGVHCATSFTEQCLLNIYNPEKELHNIYFHLKTGFF